MALTIHPGRASSALIRLFVPPVRRLRGLKHPAVNPVLTATKSAVTWNGTLLIVAIAAAFYGDSVVGGRTGEVIAGLGILTVILFLSVVIATTFGIGRGLRGHRNHERRDLPRS